MTFNKMRFIATATAVIVCVGAADRMAAQRPSAGAKNVFYTASGTFASPAVSGFDLLELAGQQFSLTLVALSSLTPSTHGATWAKYTGLTMSGTACSAQLPGTPLPIQSQNAALELATGNPAYDVLSLFCPVYVGLIGEEIYLTSTIQLPKGTLSSALIRPFTAPVALTSTTDITYSNHINSTVLAVQSGTVGTCLAGDTGCPPPQPLCQ